MVIYKTTNLINGKIYVGKDAKNNPKYYGSGNLIKLAIKKYGKENFKKEIIEYCLDCVELSKREIYWIKELNSIDKLIGYNLSEGGIGGCLGCKASDETKAKLSGKNNHFYGKHHTDETKEKLSKALKGREIWNRGIPTSDETKEKLSKALKGREIWNRGKLGIYSEESKLKMSKAKLGKKASNETKAKMSESRMGRISGMLGKTHSKESKNKISEFLNKVVVKIINNEIVGEWSSTKEASEFLNITVKSVGYFCRKKDITNKYSIIYKIDYENK